ncbi:MAG: class E sortase [Acidimicrobiales bacterium]
MLSRILGAIGRTLITAGTLILLFVAYQLWGTGLQTQQSQRELGNEFEQLLDGAATSTTTSTSAPTTTTTDPFAPPTTVPTDGSVAPVQGTLPSEGDPIAEIQIPSIGITRTVVSGISLDQLKRGPGHYPETPLPGQAGNVAIAGHRTTYGQPFHNIDKIEVGDQITFKTLQGTFVYEVTEHLIVSPDQVEVLQDQGDNRITLIACEPKYSAAQRYILIGQLQGQPVPMIEGQAEAMADAAKIDQVSIDEGSSTPRASKRPAVLWGLAAAGVWLVTWLAQVLLRRRMRKDAELTGEPVTRSQRLFTWAPYVVGLPVFLVVLYVFFENFGRLLPGNY